jgi:integrase/recombinase XerD
VSKDNVEEFLNIRSLSGISNRVFDQVHSTIYHYIEYVDFKIDKKKSLQYFSNLKDNHSVSYYRKQLYQILKFLNYLNVEWTEEIQLPAEPVYHPKYVSKEDIIRTLKHFENHEYKLRFNAIIYLGIDTGMRAEELYQLCVSDIDLDNRCIHINHNPNNGQSTKTKQSRVSFFTEYTKQVLDEYLTYFNDKNILTTLFPKRWLEGKFKITPIRVKHLRKYFSQEWDRRRGATGIKKC